MTQGTLRYAAVAVLLLAVLSAGERLSERYMEGGSLAAAAWAAPAPIFPPQAAPFPAGPRAAVTAFGPAPRGVYSGAAVQGRGAYSTSGHRPGFAQ